VSPDLLLSSPAERARTTAAIMAEAIGYPVAEIRLDDRVYSADFEQLLEVVWALDDRFEHVILFGHNPTITEFVNRTAGAGIVNVPTCGIVELRFEVQHWVDCDRAKLMHYDYPKKLASGGTVEGDVAGAD
jgi:phosphohistidine phosphatase